jgi:hypothetical protein
MADLTSFGVPTDSGSSIVMPKLQYRFRVKMINFGTDASSNDFTQNVISVTRPSLTHDEITIDAYNSRAYVAGKHTWEPITITLRDDINNNVNRHVAAQLQKQLNHGLQSAPATASQYKFGILVEQLDGAQPATVIETWSMNGCFVQNVNYGENNYATSDVMNITLQIRFDAADIHNSELNSDGEQGALSNGVLGAAPILSGLGSNALRG